MTVAELIEKLNEMPQDMQVNISAYCEEKEAEDIYVADAFGCSEPCVLIQ